MTNTTILRRATAAAMTLGCALSLAACGNDSVVAAPAADRVAATAAAPTVASVSRGNADRDTTKACAAEHDSNAAFQTETPFPKGDAPTEKELAAIRAFATDRLLPLTDTLVANVPTALVSAAEGMRSDVAGLAKTGDLSPFYSNSTGAYPHYMAVSLGLLPDCGDPVITVRATEAGYSGVPATIDPGLVRFHLINEDKESHELALVRRAADDTGDLASIAELSPDEAQARYDTPGSRVAGTGPAGTAADEAVLSVVLVPGRYLVFDTTKAGTTSDDHEGTGAPGYTRGLLAEFVVPGDTSAGK